jgi:hypothetical protein
MAAAEARSRPGTKAALARSLNWSQAPVTDLNPHSKAQRPSAISLLVTVIVGLVVFAGVVAAAKYFPVTKETTGAGPAEPRVDQKSPDQSDRVPPKNPL